MSSSRSSLRRVITAFFTAIRLTMRGETLKSADERALERAAARYPKLNAWMETTRTLIDQIDAAAGAGLNDLRLKIDKREIKARTILDTIRFHAVQEYPFMLKNESQYNLMGIQATNLNDRYRVMQLGSAEGLPETITPLITALRDHLETIPIDSPPQAL